MILPDSASTLHPSLMSIEDDGFRKDYFKHLLVTELKNFMLLSYRIACLVSNPNQKFLEV